MTQEELPLLSEQLRQIFLPSLKLSYSNLETLINNDEKYIEVHKKIEENSKIDKEVLGEYYQGFDTDIVSINETILHLEGFLKRLKSITYPPSFQVQIYIRHCRN